MNVEEEYMDVLQNIEFALASVYREDEEMTDWQTLKALEGLIRVYRARERKRSVPAVKLDGLALLAFERADAMCQARLGEVTEGGKGTLASFLSRNQKNVSAAVLVACLKRIQKSVKRWQKEGGRRGYFNYIKNFVK